VLKNYVINYPEIFDSLVLIFSSAIAGSGMHQKIIIPEFFDSLVLIYSSANSGTF
jgi:hypothetical protein